MTDGLVWEERPELARPVLVAAFEGWNDAGDAATGAVEWLVRRSEAHRFAWIDPDENIDYQSHRPKVEIVDGLVRSVAWPANECFAAGFAQRDLVVLRGVEPNVRWKSFCNTVIRVACETGCEMIVTFGALLGDVPHTRRSRVIGTATDPQLIDDLDLAQSHYEGPTGIVGVLHDSCRAAGLQSASLWAPVPHYVASPPNPPAMVGLLERFARLVDVSFDLASLDELADMWRARVDQAIAGNDEVHNYVRELEARVDAQDAVERGTVLGGHPAGSGTAPLAHELIDEVEQFLREQQGEA